MSNNVKQRNTHLDIPDIFKNQPDQDIREGVLPDSLQTRPNPNYMPKQPVNPTVEQVPAYLKSSEHNVDLVHNQSLLDICEGYNADDAEVVCGVFARRYPDIMFNAIITEHKQLIELSESVRKVSENYKNAGAIA